MAPCRIALVVLLSVLAQAQEDSCPADGSGKFGCSGDLGVPDQDLTCVRFRQTANCDPRGARSGAGKHCEAQVESGDSGYCECRNGRKAREVGCGHRPFSCEVECKQLRRYVCIGWRQTSGCSPDGDREAQHDQTCKQVIQPDASGYCECGDGRKIRKPGCQHGEVMDAFTCEDQCLAEPDLYEELGVDSSAPDKAIKQAFRKLSLKFHPDKTRSDVSASARFAAIREAYDIISDPEKRGLYDALGLSIVYEIKGGKVEKGPSSTAAVSVTLADLYNGKEFKTYIQRKVICKGCGEGSPTRQKPSCKRCNVQCANEIQLVNVRMGPMIVQQQQEVASKEKCRIENREVVIDVEPGLAAGETILFKGLGEQKPKMIPGDLVLKIEQSEEKAWKRVGRDLHTTVDLSLKEALLGFSIDIVHLDGRTLKVKVDSITKPGQIIKIDNEGFPSKGDPTSKGHLYITCHIEMPKALSENVKSFLKANLPE